MVGPLLPGGPSSESSLLETGGVQLHRVLPGVHRELCPKIRLIFGVQTGVLVSRFTSGMAVTALAAALHIHLDVAGFLARGVRVQFRGIGCPFFSNSANRGPVGPAPPCAFTATLCQYG